MKESLTPGVDSATPTQWHQEDDVSLPPSLPLDQVPASVSARLLLCFSLLTNWRLLFAKARGGPFDALDGIRTLSMCWVIFGHTFIFALFSLHFMNFGTEVRGKGGRGDTGIGVTDQERLNGSRGIE